MLLNKIVIYCTLIIPTVFGANFNVKETSSVIITEKSTLFINGKSNVNNFSCLYNIDKIKKPIAVVYSTKDNKIYFSKTTLLLNNTYFDCGGNGINKDFLKTLNTINYPEIALTLNQIETTETPSVLRASVTIQIAGVSRNYDIPVDVVKHNMLNVNGQLKLKLTDFNLKAPSKLFGIISVEDNIDINFNLEIEAQ